MSGIIDSFVNLNTGIKKDSIDKTWTTYRLPPQTRAGLFQTSMSNIQDVWDIRSNSNIRKIFEILYSELRNTKIKNYIVSGDGINIKPGSIGPIAKQSTKDWAHFDQTFGDIYKCIQGQMVLTNTSASFVASPGSHKVFHKILKKYKINNTSNWFKLTPEQYEDVKKIIIKSGGNFQIPILAPKGSFIVWTSALLHSARIQQSLEYPTKSDPWNGWRGVVYVCYRPKSDFTSAQIKKRQNVFNENRVTNHWSTRMFGKKPGSRFLYSNTRHTRIEKAIVNPKYVYIKLGKTKLTSDQKKLLGL
jgi:hypothetical protein